MLLIMQMEACVEHEKLLNTNSKDILIGQEKKSMEKGGLEQKSYFPQLKGNLERKFEQESFKTCSKKQKENSGRIRQSENTLLRKLSTIYATQYRERKTNKEPESLT